ncbi:RNA polymerase sigma factor [uncultured Duncaniella sp.]|uniref:RNA polymerase sigma factor n=1 Tax=uncultured Duncaniella sp. TaxID=2768039 RepID=UPI0026470EBD|nr:RNA polymerase sigma factor [uncultured Duncaniella sp.]
MKLICHPALFRHVEFVRSWLLISLKNIMFDRLKSVKPSSSLDEVPFMTIEENILAIAQTEGLDDEQIKDRRNLAKAFKLLGGSQRMAVYLHFVRGLSHKEVAALLDMNVQSSRNLLSRAISKLRKNMFTLMMLLTI